ncbi:MAG: FG-GAP-like repeat-containing protein [Candidatus Krumholzibacteriia bacterium]
MKSTNSCSRGALVLAAAVCGLLAWTAAVAAEFHDYPCEPDLIEIMFIQESMVRLIDGWPEDFSGLNATEGVDVVLASAGGGEWMRLTDVPEAVLDDLAFNAGLNLGEPVYNLNNIYRIRLFSGVDPRIVAFDLENLPGVHLAYPVALPPELPVPTDYMPTQNYLDPASGAPVGVDAYYAWTQTGGSGFGVTVCDLEYSWNDNHSDLFMALGSQINTNVADPFSNTNHGTAVLGELISTSNGWGTTGVSHGANILTCGTYYGLPSPTWNIAGAMTIALTNLSAGDVMLLEQQWDYTGAQGYVPVEWYPHQFPAVQTLNAVYAVIMNAVGNGVSVVEAGGNGAVDTDTMTWYGDSGAVIVGAGGAYSGGTYTEGDLQKLSFSSYGSRFDLQGWGENVVTCGYSDLYSAEGYNLWYTSTFSGTSSASPIVAGAIACLNGWYASNVSSTPLSPGTIRTTLKTTGTPQISPPAGNIGPRPDLFAAIQSLVVVPPPLWTDVTAGPLGDAGYGKSVAWGDYDGDKDDDLYITNAQSQNRVLRNDGPLGFADVTTPVEANFLFAGAAEWGDFDNDGDLDIYCGNWNNQNRLYRNDGLLGFFNATMPPVDDIQDGSGVAWIDFDNDSWLDLHVSTMHLATDRLFQQLPGSMGTFSDATIPPIDNPLDSHDAAWSDFDNDGDLDCYAVNLNGPNEMFMNFGNGVFLPFADPAIRDPGQGSGASWGDFDGDGRQDLYLTNQTSGNRLYRNTGLLFVDVTNGPLADPTSMSMGASWADYDNDGDLDLYLANAGSPNKLLRNDGSFLFSDDTNGPLGDAGGGQGTAWADYDNDGDLDIYLMNWGSSNKLFRNDINNGNHWIEFDLHGFNCNAAAIGAKVKIVVAGQAQYRELGTAAGYCSQNSFRVHFGLGAFAHVDTVVVDWPGYGKETFLALAGDNRYSIHQNPASAAPEPAAAATTRLHPGSPNPFNPSTTIRFELRKSGPVSLEIYDVAGRSLKTLVSGDLTAGPHSMIWRGDDRDGRTLPSGVYFARLQADGTTRTTKLMMMK